MALYPISRIITIQEFPFAEHLQGSTALEFFNKLYYENASVYRNGSQVVLGVDLLLEEPMLLPIPFLPNFKIDIGSDESGDTVFNTTIGVGTNPFIDIRDIPIKLQIGKELLQPLDANGNPDPSRDHIEINLGAISIYADKTGIFLDEDITVDIPLSMIGNTGLKIKIDNLTTDLSATSPELQFGSCQLILPDYFILPAETKILLQQAKIATTGFSGNTAIELPLTYVQAEKKFKYNDQDTTILGIPGGLKQIQVSIENNQPIAFNLEGQVIIPYFDVPVDVQFTIEQNGDITTSIKSTDGSDIVLKKDELIAFYIQSLQLKKEGEVGSITLSGGLEPMLYASEGMKWPRMDVKNLMISSDGIISIEEAWLDLKDMATLDLFGFHMELRRIGIGTIGTATDKKLWLDITGGVKLVEQIPIGVDVEGFRMIWPQNIPENYSLAQIASSIGIQFKGVQFSFGVPGALQIDGLIRFFKDPQAVGFAGDMVLIIPAAGINAEAGLLVGMNTEQPNPYAFFYVYFGLESAAGIPLGQSGLALKGAMGLFGINVTPDKSREQNWYYDWYKRAPAPGAHQTTKWTYQRDSLAIGAGVTITTVDGVVKGTKGIIVLALPGPILVINGKALVLNGLNPDPAAEPPFSATAVFDGREKIVQFNIEAQAEIVKDMVDAHAGVEAFFDFKDVTNWHLYLGQDQPQDRRIRANILNIIEADAYLMLDMVGADSPRARMGVSVSVKPKIDSVEIDIPFTDDDPAITFKAHLDIGGKGEISVQPEQFSGEATIDAGIEVRALGFEIEISADARLGVEGPAPFSLEATLNLDAKLPDPLPDYHGEFDYKLEIPAVNLDIQNPLTSVSLFSRFTSESKSTPIYSNPLTDNQLNDIDPVTHVPLLPMVDCDVNPILSFEHEMNQDCNFVMHPGGDKTYETGILLFTPTLQKVMIEEKKKSGGSWNIIYNTTNETLPGVWLAESDPGSPGVPASRRLQLLTTNALVNTVHSSGTIGYPMMQTEAASKHLSELILEDYPTLVACPSEPVKSVCLEFRYPKTIEGKSIKWGGIEFSHASGMIIISGNCLRASTGLRMIFPDRIIELRIEFCTDPGAIKATTYQRPRGSKLKDVVEKAKSKREKPDFGCSLDVKNSIVKSESIATISCAEGFDCITVSTNNEAKISIKKICYKTATAQRNQKRNETVCRSNTTLLTPPTGTGTSPSGNVILANNLFSPGCYYRVTIQSKVEGEVISNNDKNEDILELYLEMLDKVLGTISAPFTRYAYFQTDAPPENITAYIKWSLPFHQSRNIFKSAPLFIRFKREYLHALYNNNNFSDYKMQIVLKDVTGEIIPSTLSWLSANSYTLFPDEQNWKNHLASAGFSMENKKDDILKISIGDPGYKEKSRYEMIIAGAWDSSANANNAEDKKAILLGGRYYRILHTQTFQTSRFASLEQLIKNDTGGCRVSVVKGNSVSFGTTFASEQQAWVEAEFDFHTTSVDYEYGIAKHSITSSILVSKEAVEAKRVLLRNAKEKVDTTFRLKAQVIQTELLFRSNDNQSEIFLIETGEGTNAKIDYVWIQLPESINLKKVISATRTFGNLSIDIVSKNTGAVIASSRIFNTDTSKLIIKLSNRVIAADIVTKYKIRVGVNNDYEDDKRENIFGNVSNNHHRYDRASQKDFHVQSVDLDILR